MGNLIFCLLSVVMLIFTGTQTGNHMIRPSGCQALGLGWSCVCSRPESPTSWWKTVGLLRLQNHRSPVFNSLFVDVLLVLGLRRLLQLLCWWYNCCNTYEVSAFTKHCTKHLVKVALTAGDPSKSPQNPGIDSFLFWMLVEESIQFMKIN